MPVFSKFLSLPLLAQKNVFRLMHITDLFFFSQTSKRAERLVNAATLKVYCLLTLRKNEMVVTLLNTERPDKERFSWSFSRPCELNIELDKAIINGKKIEFWFDYGRNAETNCEDLCGVVNMIFNHYQYLFVIKNYAQIGIEHGVLEDIPAILRNLNITVTTSVVFSDETRVSKSDWNQVIENLKFERLIAFFPIAYTVDFSKISHIKFLRLEDAGRFTGEHLLQITPIEYVQLVEVIPFDTQYLKRYVQNWLERTDDGYLSLEIQLGKRNEWKHLEESFSELKTFSYDPKRRPERFRFKRLCQSRECHNCTGEYTEDCKNGRDVVRSDGRIATIILKPNSFMMFAWDERYRQ